MGIHDGHRARLRARYIEEGLAHFNEIDTLELLLFYAIPRRDTNELAHLLLQQFGSLDGVLGATTGDLCAVPGISENTAVLLHLFNDVARKCEISRQSIRIVNSSQDAGTFLLPYFYGLREETVYLLCLDAKGKVLDCRALFKGSANGVASLGADGKVPSSQLPSYVDDVVEGYYYNEKFYTTAAHTTEIAGETGKIYVDLSTNVSYRYGGSAYVAITNGNLAPLTNTEIDGIVDGQ